MLSSSEKGSEGIGAQYLQSLAKLDLSFCPDVGSDVLAGLSSLPLTELSLGGCQGVDAAGLGHVAHLRSLQTLFLGGCTGVDAAGLECVSQLMSLTSLNLSFCAGVDAAGLSCVAKLRSLKSLNLRNCAGVDVTG